MLTKKANDLLSKLYKDNGKVRKELEKEANLLFIPLKLDRKYYSDPIEVPSGEDSHEDWFLTVEPLENGRVKLSAVGEWSRIDHLGEAPPEFLEKVGEAFKTLIENMIYGAEYECRAIQAIRQRTNTKMRKSILCMYDLYKPKRKRKDYDRLMQQLDDRGQ